MATVLGSALAGIDATVVNVALPALGASFNAAHPLIRSFEPGEEWFYCYLDEVALNVPDAPPAPSRP